MIELVVSDEVKNSLDNMQSELRERALEKLELLVANPRHPSLNAHRLKRAPDKWECYFTETHRIIYDFSKGKMRLWKMGDHSVIDRVHTFSFSPHTSFCRWELEEPSQIAKPRFEIPAAWLQTQEDHTKTNPLALVPPSHLRILGVPSDLVKALQKAPSMETALSIPGLPQRTVEWLMELLTNRELNNVLFDSARLIFRTTLDKLKGYCQGKIKRLMLNLEAEQERYVDREYNGAVLLRGTAGSGKTTVAIYRAIKCAKKGDRVILLTYTKTLIKAAQSLILELVGSPLPSNMEVINLDKWIRNFLKKRKETSEIIDDVERKILINNALENVKNEQQSFVLDLPPDFFANEIEKVIKANGLKTEVEYLEIPRYGRKKPLGRQARLAAWAVYEVYQKELKKLGKIDWQDISLLAFNELSKQSLDNPYDHVIIDEVQDLTSMQVKVAQLLTKGGKQKNSSIFIIGDVSQTLYSRGFAWKQAGIQLQGRSFSIRRNFRNTRQIAEAAALLNSYNNFQKLSDDYVSPEFTKRHGPWPIIMICDVTQREPRVICDKILDLTGDNLFRISDFAILCPSRSLCETLRSYLVQSNIPCVVHYDESFEILGDQVKILTIHSAKGLEFPVVFLTGLHDGVLPNRRVQIDDEEQAIALESDRTLMYVGMTRAAEYLYLVTSDEQPSAFLREISKLTRQELYSGGKH